MKGMFDRFTTAIVGVVAFMLLAESGVAQTYTVLYRFSAGYDGSTPMAGLFRDSAGSLYGTTYAGGMYSLGTIFELAADGDEAPLYSFNGSGDGQNPVVGVVGDAKGNLYGTTPLGGSASECEHQCGETFELTSTGSFEILHSFGTRLDGATPEAPVILDAKDNVYGTTAEGGNTSCGSCGVVYAITAGEKETVVHRFGSHPGDGKIPLGGLLADPAGNGYGTTSAGGTSGAGTVYKIDGTTHQESVFYSFTGGDDGGVPYGSLVRDSAGNLYGTTSRGGAFAQGAVFELNASGTETVLYSFTGGADGGVPQAGLAIDSAGNLYGTTTAGGDTLCALQGCGVIFEVNASRTETTLYPFPGGIEGALSFGGLILDSSGNLYGTASIGGNVGGTCGGGCGVVFELTP
jgi:uncharacterized repeat protein (TIGR03803 family)